ncbi:mitochondrial glycine transporter B-like [Haliotis asinina]|uniref:mitochondrial glycine transporter B-like n=1 Tax=Haliotis asinina TaxID=109174 RepID=UPI003531E1C7
MDAAFSSPVVKSFVAGSLSGTCSTLLFQPLDLVKTRVQLSINFGKTQGIVSVLTHVIEKDRLVGLWRGVVPSITRCVPGVGIYFASLHWLRTNFGTTDPHPMESLLLGATARSVAAVAVLPFTVIKTRYESGSFQYSSMSRALVITHQKEGLKGLYCGLGPTLMRDVPFSSLYLMFYTQLKKTLPEDMLQEKSLPLFHFMCGIMAGTMASVVTQPADVIKTHAQLNPAMYDNIRACALHVYQKDGLVGFWRGIIPRTLRRTLMAAMAWTIYEEAMRHFSLKT